MKYENVIKLITPQFIETCCKLSMDFEFFKDDKFIKMTYDKSIPIYLKLATLIENASNRLILQTLLFQAFENWIILHDTAKFYISIDSSAVYWKYNNKLDHFDIIYFEDNKPLSKHTQALICALDKVFELERENDNA